MDLIKIGKYIATKRKDLGFTQKQIAEKLGMSDKSVSKWERGICLPDVSVYIELCDILGISINEFFAGEDISEENIVKKSEDNLIQVTKDSKDKQKSLKRMLAILLVITIITASLLGTIIFFKLDQPSNYIVAVERDSTEMQTAELLSGVDGAFLFKYFTKDEFQTLTIYMSEYRLGKLVSKEEIFYSSYTDSVFPSPKEGMIVLIPDNIDSEVDLIVATEYSKITGPITIDSKSYNCRSASQIEGETIIQYGKEQGAIIEHYIISSGIKEIINSSEVAKHFKAVFACDFYYDDKGEAAWPKIAINFTGKTQYLYKIRKGILDETDQTEVNKKYKEKRIPFRNMIYIGDGLTDIPCMTMLKKQGGKSIGVYVNKHKERVQQFLVDDRVNYVCPANYKENSYLDKTVKLIIKSTCLISELAALEEKQTIKAENDLNINE